jgi:hypothetical protein
MRKNTGIRIALIAAAGLAVGYPQWVWLQAGGGFPPSSPLVTAQAWGLLAFPIMWLHIVAGPFRKQLDALFPRYHQWIRFSSLVVLAAILLHPLLMFLGLQKLTGKTPLEIYAAAALPVWAAIVGWFMLITYDIARPFKKRIVGTRIWYWVTLVATTGWFLILYHSLMLGSHLQRGPLRALWFFFGITAAAAAIHEFLIKPFKKPMP